MIQFVYYKINKEIFDEDTFASAACQVELEGCQSG
jgi:hypothetical protein